MSDMPPTIPWPYQPVRADEQTRSSLNEKRTLRFLLRTPLQCESKHSKPVIAWAEAQVSYFSSTFQQTIRGQDGGFNTQLNFVQLRNSPGTMAYAIICFDFFLEDCPKQTRAIVTASVFRPLHDVYMKSGSFQVCRFPHIDIRIASCYVGLQGKGGSWPYFSDIMQPSTEYLMGHRDEEPESGSESKAQDGPARGETKEVKDG